MKIINVVFLSLILSSFNLQENKQKTENIQSTYPDNKQTIKDNDIPSSYEKELEEKMQNMDPEQQQKFMDELNDKLQSLSNMGCIQFVQNQLSKYTYDIKKIQKKTNGPEKIKKLVGQLYNICKGLDQEQQFKFMVPNTNDQDQNKKIKGMENFNAISILQAEDVNIEKEELEGYNNYEKYAKEIDNLKSQANNDQSKQKKPSNSSKNEKKKNENKNKSQKKNRGSNKKKAGFSIQTLHPLILIMIVLLCFIVPGMFIWNQLFNKEEEIKKKKNKKKKTK